MHSQVCTNRFLRREMINERPRYAQTAISLRFAAAACTTGLDRVEVFSERRMLEVEDAVGSDRIPKPLKRDKHAK
jgi:hypothetical protein